MNHATAQHMMMETPKFNEYEQREAKNFILLDSSKEEFTSSNHFSLNLLSIHTLNCFQDRNDHFHRNRRQVSQCPTRQGHEFEVPRLAETNEANFKLVTGPFCLATCNELSMRSTRQWSTTSIWRHVKKQFWCWKITSASSKRLQSSGQ